MEYKKLYKKYKTRYIEEKSIDKKLREETQFSIFQIFCESRKYNINQPFTTNSSYNVSGSGFLMYLDKKKSIIITNAHVVSGGTKTIWCQIASDKTIYGLELIAISLDKDLIINEVVYNSFVWVTLGCFGISSFEKVKTK